jgi:hypothetical protein
MTVGEITRQLFEKVTTADDVTRIVDDLSAHVVFMDVSEPLKGEMFYALQVALKTIQSHQ